MWSMLTLVSELKFSWTIKFITPTMTTPASPSVVSVFNKTLKLVASVVERLSNKRNPSKIKIDTFQIQHRLYTDDEQRKILIFCILRKKQCNYKLDCIVGKSSIYPDKHWAAVKMWEGPTKVPSHKSPFSSKIAWEGNINWKPCKTVHLRFQIIYHIRKFSSHSWSSTDIKLFYTIVH